MDRSLDEYLARLLMSLKSSFGVVSAIQNRQASCLLGLLLYPAAIIYTRDHRSKIYANKSRRLGYETSTRRYRG